MASSFGGTLYLIFIQVASRGLTFIGNQILLRFLSPKLLGIAVQLELVSVTVLYFARESLRVALQRQPVANAKSKNHGSTQYQVPVNLSYLAVGLGLIIALISGQSYLRVADLEVTQSPSFRHVFILYGVATLIELGAEPFFVVIQQHSLYKRRARAETSGAIARCFFACATAFVASKQGQPPSILPFAVGQLAYSIVLFSLYLYAAYAQASNRDFKLMPRSITASSDYIFSLFDRSILSLAATLYLQSIFKLLLTEGDRLILSFLASLSDQGAFALVANYGGLLARLVFQPIEESSRNTFGRLLASTSRPAPSLQANGNTKATSPPSGAHNNTKIVLSHLSTALRIYTIASLPLLALIPPLIPFLAPLLLSSHWRTSSTTALLSTYIYLIPFLAVNGILDAFVTSVATPKQLRLQSVWMAGFTVVYGGVCWVMLGTLKWGSEGLVWANVVNMILRIGWGIWFLDSWIAQHARDDKTRTKFWKDSRPDLLSVVVAVLVGVGLSSKSLGIGAETATLKAQLLPGIDLDLSDLTKLITAVVVLGSAL